MKISNTLIIIISILILAAAFYIGYTRQKNTDENEINLPNSENVLNTETTNPITNQNEETKENITNNNQNKKMQAIFQTNKGNFTIELFPNLAPKTVENFTKLAKEGFYNNTKFHRVIEGFMNQGGDPLSKDDAMESRWGTGGPGYQFQDEIHAENKNIIGTISMANAGPNTNGSQFFINVANNNFLDTKHTVFGKVVSGLDVVLEINTVRTNEYDRPIDPVIINKIELN
jgi:cyclophilin family peptidyl-prolyl cis-trans isomerase